MIRSVEEKGQTAKECLNQVRLYDVHINEKIEEMEQLKALTMKITSTWKTGAVSGSGSQDKIGDAVAKIVDLENEINRAVDAYVDKKREVSAIIERIQDPDQIAVLYKRYFKNEPWEQIACEMGFTYRHITRIHGEALRSFSGILKDVLKCP